MLFPVGMDEISRAVNSWTELSWRKWRKTCGQIWASNDGQPRQTEWVIWTQLCAAEMTAVLAGDLMDRRDTAGTSLCAYFALLFQRENPKNAPSTWKLPCFRSLPGVIARLCVDKVSSKKASVKWEQNNAEESLPLWNRIGGSSFKIGDLVLTGVCTQSTRKLGREFMAILNTLQFTSYFLTWETGSSDQR